MGNRIIAVFGPSHHKTPDGKAIPVNPNILAWARAVGAVVAEGDHILLTGGSKPGVLSVKDVALCDVGDKRWVGVLQGGLPKKDFCARLTNCTILPTKLGRRRNFLEALICDAAIAFAGGDGTLSEVACAFALQRPLALVDGDWEHRLDDPAGPKAAAGLLKAALEYLRAKDAPVDRHFESLIESCLEPARGPGLLEDARQSAQPLYRYFDLKNSATPAEVVDWAATVPLPNNMPPGDRPELQGNAPLATAYRRWLDAIEQLA